MDCYNQNHTKGLKRKMFEIIRSQFGSSKRCFNKVKYGDKFGNQEVDCDYAYLLRFLLESNNQKTVDTYESDDENENKNENGNEKEDEINKDPQYCMFFKNLTENGKSYKLKISKNDEAPCFLEYEKYEDSNGYISIVNNGDNVKSSESQRVKRKIPEVSRKKKINEHKPTEPRVGITVDSCYEFFLKGCRHSENGAFNYKGNVVKFEEKDTSSGSDIQIFDNVRDYSEVNNKQVAKQNSLKEKLIRILRKPYNKKEYEELSKYVEQKKPICRLLPLRHRSISSALTGVTKSVLEDSPGCFRRKLEAAKNERPRALNLLRMFCFWLEHVPNEDVFEPWLDKNILEVLPLCRPR